MPETISARDIPGLFYAQTLTASLLRDYHTAPDARKLAIEAELLNLGRHFLNVAAPLAVKAGFGWQPFEDLYKQCYSIVAPHWRTESEFQEPRKEDLILDVAYELQREVRQLRDRLNARARRQPHLKKAA